MKVQGRRLQRFLSDRSAMASAFILLWFTLMSFTAELWINSRPIAMKYQGQMYFPAYVNYSPNDLKIEGFAVSYKDAWIEQADWVWWPFIRWGPLERNDSVQSFPSPPSGENWLGTDANGRDVLARLVYGYRYSLSFAVGVWLLSYIIGVGVGGLTGFLGGRFDFFGTRFVEILEMTPILVILVTVISLIRPDFAILIVLLALFEWPFIFYHSRLQFLTLRRRDFVLSAQAMGVTTFDLIWKHILPNAMTPILTFSPFAIATNISLLTVLDYLGLGLVPPTPSWGDLFSQAQKYVHSAQWLVWSPSIALVVTMLCLLSIGRTLRDVFE